MEHETVHGFCRFASLFRYWTIAGTSDKTISKLLGHVERLIRPATSQIEFDLRAFMTTDCFYQRQDNEHHINTTVPPAGTVPPPRNRRSQGDLRTGGQSRVALVGSIAPPPALSYAQAVGAKGTAQTQTITTGNPTHTRKATARDILCVKTVVVWSSSNRAHISQLKPQWCSDSTGSSQGDSTAYRSLQSGAPRPLSLQWSLLRDLSRSCHEEVHSSSPQRGIEHHGVTHRNGTGRCPGGLRRNKPSYAYYSQRKQSVQQPPKRLCGRLAAKAFDS